MREKRGRKGGRKRKEGVSKREKEGGREERRKMEKEKKYRFTYTKSVLGRLRNYIQ